MTVITLCGSTRFIDEFDSQNRRLTLMGNVVLSVGVIKIIEGSLLVNSINGYRNHDISEKEKDILQAVHREKINMSDEILVINVDGYIGDHTKEEIEYAKKQGKVIKYLEAIK